MESLVAVVEIDGTTGVIILAVFVIVFLVVAALAWSIVRKTTVSSRSTLTGRLSTDIPLPVSRPETFDRVVKAVTKGMSRPSLTSEQQQFVAGLAKTRKKVATAYRWGLMIAGIAGVGLSIAIYRGYRDDEMILLPVGIIFLVSLGVFLSGLVPSRVVDPIEPIDPALLKNIHVDVATQPLTVQLDEATREKSIELLRGGMEPEQVARQVVPGYDHLNDPERQEVQRAIDRLRH